jgi:hypothetical protein
MSTADVNTSTHYRYVCPQCHNKNYVAVLTSAGGICVTRYCAYCSLQVHIVIDHMRCLSCSLCSVIEHPDERHKVIAHAITKEPRKRYGRPVHKI